jgi:hypothetical protein
MANHVQYWISLFILNNNEEQIGCMSVFTISLYIYLYVLSQHVSVIYDHHQAVFTCTLTPVFLLFLPTLANKRCINKYTRKS